MMPVNYQWCELRLCVCVWGGDSGGEFSVIKFVVFGEGRGMMLLLVLRLWC